jgi:hypothetical protein
LIERDFSENPIPPFEIMLLVLSRAACFIARGLARKEIAQAA